jgi:hypothetical protein
MCDSVKCREITISRSTNGDATLSWDVWSKWWRMRSRDENKSGFKNKSKKRWRKRKERYYGKRDRRILGMLCSLRPWSPRRWQMMLLTILWEERKMLWNRLKDKSEYEANSGTGRGYKITGDSRRDNAQAFVRHRDEPFQLFSQWLKGHEESRVDERSGHEKNLTERFDNRAGERSKCDTCFVCYSNLSQPDSRIGIVW